MIPISWTANKPIPNLATLLDRYRGGGGRIIMYRRVLSLVVITVSSPHFEWVPNTGSRAASGWRHTLFCLLAGWWSLSGFFGTIGAIAGNLLDVLGGSGDPYWLITRVGYGTS